jgi:hypothetical protein
VVAFTGTRTRRDIDELQGLLGLCRRHGKTHARHIAGTTWSAKCYMNMKPLYQQHLTETEAVA